SAVFVQAQEHMEFKGIPISGHIDSFVAKLESSGFKKKTVNLNDNACVLTGQFVGKACEVFVICSPKTKQVWKVAVFLPKSSGWHSIKGDYNSFKTQFTTKYGNPTNSFEFFSKPYYEGDGYEMTAIKVDKCNYMSFWTMAQGTISVAIGTTASIIFAYEDEINRKLKSVEEKSKIQDDI
ncbi:MAG: hypothetical protein R3Y38_07490, partial [Rikenellaceae bacterium]